MDILETIQTINLTKTSDGTIRVGKKAIDELEIMIFCSRTEEWQNIIKILPL